MKVLLVPRGAETRAVQRGARRAQIVSFAAGAAAAASLPEPFTATLAIVIGLCGGLRSKDVGTTVIYRSVIDEAGEVLLPDYALAVVRAALPRAPLVRACTTDRVVTQRDARSRLSFRFDSEVVDMEGTHLARALHARSIPVAMVRVISDDARRELPPIEDAFAASGALQPLELARGMARDPRAAARFVLDVRRALGELTKIASALVSV